MEALFSGFHIGEMGREVMGGCCGHRFDCLVVSQACGVLEVGVVCQNSKIKKKPVN